MKKKLNKANPVRNKEIEDLKYLIEKTKIQNDALKKIIKTFKKADEN